MSLFKGQDAEGLPVLTQFYQLEPLQPHTQNLTEGEFFAYRFFSRRDPLLWEEQEKDQDAVAAFATDVNMYQRVMRHIADLTPIDEGDKKRMNELLAKEHRMFFFIDYPIEPDDDTDPHTLAKEIYINVGRARTGSKDTGHTFAEYAEWLIVNAASELADAVERKAAGQPLFPTCPICESLFLLQRKGQIYCSERCGNRARIRRLRQRSNGEIYEKTVTSDIIPVRL